MHFFAGASLPLLRLPDWEVLPYDLFSPHPDIISERLRTLFELPQVRHGCLIVAADTLMQRLPPRNYVQGRAFELKRGQSLALEPFRLRLAEAGYASVSQVVSPGSSRCAARCWMSFRWAAPRRCASTCSTMKSRRSGALTRRRSARSMPCRPCACCRRARCRSMPRRSRTSAAAIARASRAIRPSRAIYRGVSEGLAPAGVEFYQPLFFDSTATLLDYLPADTVIVSGAGLAPTLEHAWSEVAARYEERRHDIERPVLAPAELFVPPAELLGALERFAGMTLDAFKADTELTGAPAGVRNFPTSAPRELRVDMRAEQPFAPLDAFLKAFDGRVLIAADSAGRREVLQEMLRAHGHAVGVVNNWESFATGSARLALTVAPDLEGLTLTSPPIAIISEAQLFGARARQERRRKRAADPEAILRDLTGLNPGAPVVHEEYGVGRYQGLMPMEIGGQPGEFLVLEYQDGDRIYVPVQQLHLVSRYTGAAPERRRCTSSAPTSGRGRAGAPPNRSATWRRNCSTCMHAARRRPDCRCRSTSSITRAFANAFPFEETEDQAQAISEVLTDLGSERPMDRIVCGDVGFGKTEVAMRAAFIAVQSGKQVAVLAPTTLLVQQHLANFRDRFADWPVRIEALSRFGTSRETQVVLAGLEQGKVDIVIATHRLLHAQARFKDLGLIIIDEEHRFGVRDKQRLQALRANVHVLTLTATPIPRTLNMALGGLRDLSLITTAPAGRLAIKTFLIEWHCADAARGGAARAAPRRPDLLRAQRGAHHREDRRGSAGAGAGGRGAHRPRADARARPRAADGRLLPPPLQRAGVHHHHRERHRRADRQHHHDQPRRPHGARAAASAARARRPLPPPRLRLSDRPAPPGTPRDAAKRLEAIESMEELGAGFVLATHDLEIRGAGELLGEEQSGQMTEIGLSMYLDMLEHAVRALKEGREPDLEQPLAAATEVELRVPAFLPEAYVADVHVRLSLYKRIAAADSATALDELAAEIHDRFGPLPAAAQNLLRITKLKLSARALGVRRLDLGPQGGTVTFEERAAIEPATVVRLIQKHPREFRLEGPLKLRVSRALQRRGRALRLRRPAAQAPRRSAAGPLECRACLPSAPDASSAAHWPSPACSAPASACARRSPRPPTPPSTTSR